jgi:DNA-binding transcriptional LysR family regulator
MLERDAVAGPILFAGITDPKKQSARARGKISMDLRQMRQFVAVAEELNFRRAAQRLHISQPPLTAAVQRLEEELGVELLERDRRHVSLTPAGMVFLREARRMISAAQLAAEITQRAAAGMVGSLRIGFFPSAAVGILPPLLQAFRKGYPDVKLVLNAETSARQASDLQSGAIDLAIVVPPLARVDTVKVQPHGQEDIILAVPRLHALAGESSVALKALAGEDFVSYQSHEAPAFEGIVVAACQQSGFLPHVVQAASNMMAVLACVSSGAGVALVPKSMSAVQMPQVRYLRVRQGRSSVQYPFALAWNPANDNPVLPPFLSTAAGLAKRA